MAVFGSRLQGSAELRARLRALSKATKPIGDKWAADAAKRARSYAPRRTGLLKASIHVAPARQSFRGLLQARVVGMYYGGAMMQKGSKPHDEPKSRFTKTGRVRRNWGGSGKVLKFQSGGQTIFRRKVHHRGTQPNTYALRALREALGRNAGLDELIRLWNNAA